MKKMLKKRAKSSSNAVKYFSGETAPQTFAESYKLANGTVILTTCTEDCYV